MDTKAYLTNKLPEGFDFRNLIDYIYKQATIYYGKPMSPPTPYGYIAYHCRRRGWNPAFVTLLGAVYAEWYKSARYLAGWQISPQTQSVVFGTLDHGALDFCNWLANQKDVEKTPQWAEAVSHYDALLRVQEEQDLPEPVDTTPAPVASPTPRPPTAEPVPEPAKDSTTEVKDWAKILVPVISALIGFGAGWLGPIYGGLLKAAWKVIEVLLGG